MGYCALTVAILSECSMEIAFEKIQSDNPSKVKQVLSPEDIEDMNKLRSEGLTIEDLQDIFYTSRITIYRRTRQSPERVG